MDNPIAILACAGGAIIFLIWWMQAFSKGYYERYRQNFEDKSAEKIQQMYLTVRPETLITYKMLAAVSVGGAAFLITFDFPTISRFAITLLGMVYFFFVPDRVIRHMYKKRLDKFNDQLVDGLSILANALRSGLSFPQALDLLSKEMDPPISIEFQQVIQDTKLGMQLDDALKEMADRVPVEDLHLLVTAIIIVRRSGGNLAEIFDNISTTIRERRRIQGRIDSLTAQGKLQAWIVCGMPFFIAGAMMLIDFNLIRPMWHEGMGNILLLVMFSLQYIGFRIIVKVCTIDI